MVKRYYLSVEDALHGWIKKKVVMDSDYLALESRCRELEEVVREMVEIVQSVGEVANESGWFIDEFTGGWSKVLAKAKRLIKGENNGKD